VGREGGGAKGQRWIIATMTQVEVADRAGGGFSTSSIYCHRVIALNVRHIHRGPGFSPDTSFPGCFKAAGGAGTFRSQSISIIQCREDPSIWRFGAPFFCTMNVVYIVTLKNRDDGGKLVSRKGRQERRGVRVHLDHRHQVAELKSGAQPFDGAVSSQRWIFGRREERCCHFCVRIRGREVKRTSIFGCLG
jgi:hypothetical protein